MSTKTKGTIWKIISDNIKARYFVKRFKLIIFSDGSGHIVALDSMYNEKNQIFEFENPETIITEFLF